MKGRLLAVSFGTSVASGREGSLAALEDALAQAFPDCDLVRVFSAKSLLEKMEEEEGKRPPSLEEALAQALADGVPEIVVQPLQISSGLVAGRIQKCVQAFQESLPPTAHISIRLGRVLLASPEDVTEMADFLGRLRARPWPEAGQEDGTAPGEAALTAPGTSGPAAPGTSGPAASGGGFDGSAADTADLWMGHGSRLDSSSLFAGLNRALQDQQVLVGAMLGKPSFSEVLEKLRAWGVRRIRLRALLLVAGKHVVRDLLGEGPSTWEGRLRAAGYLVQTYSGGLASEAWIQEAFIRRIREARELGPGENC